MIAQHTPEGVWLYVSPGCQDLLGYTPEELAFRRPYDFIHPDGAPPEGILVTIGCNPHVGLGG